MAFDPTALTWSQLANEQSYQEMLSNNMNVTEFPVELDPIYKQLIMQISYTMYRYLPVLQRWRNIGRTAPMNAYPGILRELVMFKRKGMNYPMDAETRPSTLNSYDIINDDIDVRYHAAQFRWMYGWTLFDEELRRFAGKEQGDLIAQLTQMKTMNAVSSRNMFCDALRKKTLSVLANNVSVPLTAPVDISDYKTLTQEQALEWLDWIDNILFEMSVGSKKYNKLGEYIQTPKESLQMIIPYELYHNVVRKAFPLTISKTQYFDNILPANLILVDTLGNDELVTLTGSTAGTDPLVPTFDNHGMNLLNWDGTSNTVINTKPNMQAVIMDMDAIGIEDNLNQTLVGTKDIAKLATPVRMHYWTKAYVTDMVPSVVINSPTGASA